MSDSSQPHGLLPTRLFHPWDFPVKSAGVGCHCLLHSTLVYFIKYYELELFTCTTHKWHRSPTKLQKKKKNLQNIPNMSWWALNWECIVCHINTWHVWWRKRQSTSVFLPGESHGQRHLLGYSPWGCKELNTTEWLSSRRAAMFTVFEALNYKLGLLQSFFLTSLLSLFLRWLILFFNLTRFQFPDI